MDQNISMKDIPVHKIRLPDNEFLKLCIPAEDYLTDKLRLGREESEVFSKEAALLLAKIHPIYVWTKENYCVFGIRTLFIISNIISCEKIRVGVLPTETPKEKIWHLILADAWLTSLVFSLKEQEASLYKIKKKMSSDILKSLSPTLDLNVADFAKSIGVSVPTLYGKKGSKN